MAVEVRLFSESKGVGLSQGFKKVQEALERQ